MGVGLDRGVINLKVSLTEPDGDQLNNLFAFVCDFVHKITTNIKNDHLHLYSLTMASLL